MSKIVLWKFVAAFLCVVSITGCNKEVLDYRNAEVSRGVIYQAGADTPFTGTVTNIPVNELPFQQLYVFTSLLGSVFTGNSAALVTVFSRDAAALCDVPSKQGIIDGEVNCKLMGNGFPFFKFTLKNGALDGQVEVYAVAKRGAKIGEATIANGRLNGESVAFNPLDGKPVYRTTWQNGVSPDFDITTGELKLPTDSAVTADNSHDVDACVGAWIDAHRKEVGETAIITNDQIGEWRGWCNEGKKPSKT